MRQNASWSKDRSYLQLETKGFLVTWSKDLQELILSVWLMNFSSIRILISFHFSKYFRRFMNQYFLLIACLQLWSRITPVSPATTWGPLIIIFIVSASKEAWDDYNRYLSDKKANERKIWLVKNGIHRQVFSFLHLICFNFIENMAFLIYCTPSVPNYKTFWLF